MTDVELKTLPVPFQALVLHDRVRPDVSAPVVVIALGEDLQRHSTERLGLVRQCEISLGIGKKTRR